VRNQLVAETRALDTISIAPRRHIACSVDFLEPGGFGPPDASATMLQAQCRRGPLASRSCGRHSRLGMLVIHTREGIGRPHRRPHKVERGDPATRMARRGRWDAHGARRAGTRHHPELYPTASETGSTRQERGAFYKTDLALMRAIAASTPCWCARTNEGRASIPPCAKQMTAAIAHRDVGIDALPTSPIPRNGIGDDQARAASSDSVESSQSLLSALRCGGVGRTKAAAPCTGNKTCLMEIDILVTVVRRIDAAAVA